MIFNITFMFNSSFFISAKKLHRKYSLCKIENILVGNSFARTDERIIERDLRTFSNTICSSAISPDDDLFISLSLFPVHGKFYM